MSHNDEEYNDSIMLSESLERIAAQAMHLKEKIEAGLQLPSWAEYKVYQAYDAVNKALGTAYPGRYEMEDKKASVFDLVKSAGGGAPAQPRERELIGHFKLPIYDGDPGAPGAKVVDHHMHPVFKNEHPGIILGPDAEWVPLSTKKASVFDLVKEAGGTATTQFYDPGLLARAALGVHRYEAALAGALGGAALGGLTGHLTRKSDDKTHRRALGGAAAGAAVGGLGLPAIRQAIRNKTINQVVDAARAGVNIDPGYARSGLSPSEQIRLLPALIKRKMGEKKASVFALLRAR